MSSEAKLKKNKKRTSSMNKDSRIKTNTLEEKAEEISSPEKNSTNDQNKVNAGNSISPSKNSYPNIKLKKKKKKQKIVAGIIHRLFRHDTFLAKPGLLQRFITFFNIREQIILMDVDKEFKDVISETKTYQKYVQIRKEFVLKDNVYQKIIDSNNKEKTHITTLNEPKIQKKNKVTSTNKYKKNTKISLNKKNGISQSRLYFEKYISKDITTPVSLGLNDVLVLYPTKAGEKEKKEQENKKLIEKNNNKEKTTYNKYVSLFAGRSSANKGNNNLSQPLSKKNNNNITTNLKIEFTPLDYNKLEINSLLRNNGDKIKKLIQKYSLTTFDSKIIFNGIIEHLLLVYDNLENNDLRVLELHSLKASNSLIYYAESLLNLDFSDIIKINFDNILLNSIQVSKTLFFLFHKYSNSLRILILSHNEIDDKCAKLLFPALQQNKLLQILDLNNNNISSEGIAFSEIFFNNNMSLNTLILEHNLLGPIGVYSLCSFYRNNQQMSLSVLDLSYNGLTKEGINHLTNYILNNNSKITKLFLGGNYLCDEGINILSTIFENNAGENINVLDLQNNNLTKNSGEYISKILDLSENVEYLCLKNNNIGNDSIAKIFSSIKSKNKLISLDLSQNKLNEKSIKSISEIINNEFVLERLLLSKNNFKKACSYIKNLLTKETNLKYLKLNNCKIEDGVNLIIHGINNNKNLLILDLSENNLSSNQEQLKEFEEALKNNNILSSLILNDTYLDDIGIKYVANGLKENHSLKKLFIKNNFITTQSISLILEAINKSNTIINLDLNGNNGIDSKGLQEIANQLKKNMEKNENNEDEYSMIDEINKRYDENIYEDLI